MKSIFTTLTTLLIPLSCTTPDKRIDANYSNLTDNREAMYSLNKVVEASSDETPPWVLSYLDTWDCRDDFCVAGRTEIAADDASPFTCLDVARLNAKANLVSVIQTDISNKIIAGANGFKLGQQDLKQITTAGFEVRNLSNIRVTENYYRKVLKHSGDSPQAFYQCFSVASISKLNLQNAITREANKHLQSGPSEAFKKELQREWDRFFKLESGETNRTRLKDDEARTSIRKDLLNGSLEDMRSNVSRVASAFLDLPYQLGGDISDGSIDCSNYVRTVFRVFGLRLPRTSVEQFGDPRGESVGADLAVGDLVFFNGVLRPSDQPSHVGIYIGDGKFINANGNAQARKVQIDDFTGEYWQGKYLGAKRFIHHKNFADATVATSH